MGRPFTSRPTRRRGHGGPACACAGSRAQLSGQRRRGPPPPTGSATAVRSVAAACIGDCAARNHMRERATTAVIRPPRPLLVPGERLPCPMHRGAIFAPKTGRWAWSVRATTGVRAARCLPCTPCCPLARSLRLRTLPSSPSLLPVTANQRPRPRQRTTMIPPQAGYLASAASRGWGGMAQRKGGRRGVSPTTTAQRGTIPFRQRPPIGGVREERVDPKRPPSQLFHQK